MDSALAGTGLSVTTCPGLSKRSCAGGSALVLPRRYVPPSRLASKPLCSVFNLCTYECTVRVGIYEYSLCDSDLGSSGAEEVTKVADHITKNPQAVPISTTDTFNGCNALGLSAPCMRLNCLRTHILLSMMILCSCYL